MNKLFYSVACAALLAGCFSESEIALNLNHTADEDGEVPVGMFAVDNISYSLLGIIPFTSGVPWSKGAFAEEANKYRIDFFSHEATLDENLQAVRCAMCETGAKRVSNLVSHVDEEYLWSFFVMKRRMVRTSCTLLPAESK